MSGDFVSYAAFSLIFVRGFNVRKLYGGGLHGNAVLNW